MLKIGEFARQARVTVKALRHYARLGLFKPAWVDRFSGYRYYTPQQFPRLERIREMQTLGFSLEQIKGMLDHELNAERLCELLTRKRLEVIQRLRQEENRVLQVETRLAQAQERTGMFINVGKEKNMDPKLLTKPAMVVVGMRYQGKNANWVYLPSTGWIWKFTRMNLRISRRTRSFTFTYRSKRQCRLEAVARSW